ncbi:hypothetical protein QF002_000241 [Paraburkholderia youngii]
MKDELLDAHRTGKLMLFAGAGVPANLGLPSWDALIAHIAKELGYDPKIFSTYGTHLALAEFYKKKGGLRALCSWMDREWHKSTRTLNRPGFPLRITHKLFVILRWDGLLDGSPIARACPDSPESASGQVPPASDTAACRRRISRSPPSRSPRRPHGYPESAALASG